MPFPAPAEEPIPKDGARLPYWLKLGGEVRGRAESVTAAGFEEGANDGYYLGRHRFRVDLQPRDWFSAQVHIQDARAYAMATPEAAADWTNTVDFLHAYFDLGNLDKYKWRLRVGRQALALGEERLLGSDFDWGNLTQAFDAAHLSLRIGRAKVNLFAGGLVVVDNSQSDRVYGPSRLYGVHVELGNEERGFTFEPYSLWKTHHEFCGPEGDNLPLRLNTSGVHVGGEWRRRWSYDTEMNFQTGTAGSLPVRAWSGSWEAGRLLWNDDRAARMSGSWKYASGDSGLGQKWGAFDDLYPAGYNGSGILDPFAWRNLKDLSVAAEWDPTEKWHTAFEHHLYWVANPGDGLYVDGGPVFAYNPAPSSLRAGSQFNASVEHRLSRYVSFAAGYARFRPGPYLQELDHRVNGNTFFAGWKLTL